ncbi:MFS transporter [Clostridium sp. CS001]|uniref:MFS transporter n=1 Tax=Clostridium sp. CS001 TaxID=2880648 RepID=UPI001CF5AE81|nr:MFS transporter [Clostridium sp. CS001]MCB2289423.1 MFS transporter [Clostridium sp. CS001]
MKNNNLRMFIGGRFVSILGSGIQMIVLPLYILDITGSGALMGIFSVVTIVPALIMAPFSGILGDRKNRKNIMIVMDLGRGALICLLGILAMTGLFNIYSLFIVQIFISIMDSLFNSSSAALMPELVSKTELIEANSAKSGFDAASTILGPALGGAIYGIWGIKMVFYINSISFIISAILSMFITYNKKLVQKEEITMKLLFKENSEVLKFIVNKKGLLQLFSFAMFANFLLAPLFDIILPYALKKGIGFTSQQYGFIMGFLALGILLGNIGISVYFKKLGLRKLMKYGLVIETSLRVLVCGLLLPKIAGLYGGATWGLFITISVCCIAMEFFNAFLNTPISTNLQNLVPDEMRSRFFSILGMFSQGAMPLGALVFGTLLDYMKYYNVLIIVNTLSVLVALVFLIKACDEAFEAKSCDEAFDEAFEEKA